MTTPSTQPQPNPFWRWMAQGFWALIALAYLAFFLIDLRLDYAQMLVPCQGVECNWLAISPAEAEVLQSWGLSTQAYTVFMSSAAVFYVAVFWLLGGLVLWRMEAARLALAISVFFMVVPITMISGSSELYLVYPNLLIPWVIVSAFGRVFTFLFLYLFPNGRLYPRWAIIPLAGVILVTIISAIVQVIEVSTSSYLSVSLLLATLAFGILGGVLQILRYRRVSTPVERQQTKWALLGLIFIILSVPVWILFFGGGLDLAPGAPRLLGSVGGWALVALMGIALPITFAIAILRYNLWNIDLIIRRTLIYGGLTVLLLAIYFALVILMQNLLVAVGGKQSPVIIVLSTLFIAALFNPLRIRIQNFIDRRFYRQKYDAEKALAAFGVTVRDEVDLENLSQALLSVVEDTMQPESLSVWLRERAE